jgi:hypothetical protein
MISNIQNTSFSEYFSGLKSEEKAFMVEYYKRIFEKKEVTTNNEEI